MSEITHGCWIQTQKSEFQECIVNILKDYYCVTWRKDDVQ